MFAVIFEVLPAPGKKDVYLAIAKRLKPVLESIEGFIDNERFASQQREGWVLSLSTWRDEKSVVRWRTQGEHHAAQQRGREDVFADYHLRVGEVSADSDPPVGHALDVQRLDATEVGTAKVCTLTELTPASDGATPIDAQALAAQLGLAPGADGLIDHEVYEGITRPGKQVLRVAWRDAAAANAWQPVAPQGVRLRHRQVRVIRDYGLRERREAPQFYPPPRPA
jgi:heme-degrading monooxygenase HmoA